MKINDKENMILEARQVVTDAGLYVVPEERFDELATVAARAYENYPLHNWFSKGTYDFEVTKLIMKITLYSMKNDAVIYADSEKLNGFIVWLPPGFSGSKAIPFFKNGGLKLIAHSGLGIVLKLLKYETYAMKLKKKYTSNEDWYVYNLTVDKEVQNNGVATKLIKVMIQYCKKENKVIYLETNKEENVAIYEHFGFKVAQEGVIPGTEVKHFAMINEI